MKGVLSIWIDKEFKKFEFFEKVSFDGKRIFVDGEIVSDFNDYNVSKIEIG